VNDTDRIRMAVQQQHAKTAAVIGGGFIGLEMAENLHHAGLSVSLIEAADQVMAPLDPEMAAMLHANIRENGVDLYLGDGVAALEATDHLATIALTSGNKVEADIVILSIGGRPNSQLAKGAGLALNERGGICVDDFLRTSDASIYAVGDVIEVEDFIFKNR